MTTPANIRQHVGTESIPAHVVEGIVATLKKHAGGEYETYENTPLNADTIGWAQLPEYCINNNPFSTKVTHFYRSGVYVFHD